MIKLTKQEQAVVDRLLEIAAGKDRPDAHGMTTNGAIQRYREFIEAVYYRITRWGEVE